MAQMSWTRIKNAAKSEFLLHKKLFFITLMFSFAGAVYNVSDIEYNTYMTDEQYALDIYSGFGFILIGIAVMCGLFAVISVFKDMYSKQHADIQLSLPLSAKERYISKILSICYINVLPIMCSVAAGSLCTLIRYSFEQSALEFSGAFMLLILSFVLFTDAVALFCVCCCGTFAESIYISVIMLGCLSVTPTIFFTKMVVSFSGIECGYAADLFQFWTYSTFLSFHTNNVSSSFVIGSVVSCLISAGIIALSLYLYKKRDAVSTGKTIVYKPFFEAFMFIGAFTIFTAVSFSDTLFIGLILCILITAVIRIVVSRAKVRAVNCLIWTIKFAACLVFFIAVSAVGYVTDGFGYINYKVDAADYEDSNVTMDIIMNEHDIASYSSEHCSGEQAVSVFDFVKSYQNVKEHSVTDYLKNLKGVYGGSLVYGSDYFSDAMESAVSVYIYNEKSNKSLILNIPSTTVETKEISAAAKKFDFLEYNYYSDWY